MTNVGTSRNHTNVRQVKVQRLNQRAEKSCTDQLSPNSAQACYWVIYIH